MKILSVIPLRGGSKGIPGKNIRSLGGKPLFMWSVESAREAGIDAHLYVNTDDEAIATAAAAAGVKVYRRPAALGGDTVPSIAVLQEMLHHLEAQGEVFDALLLLQATYPFRPAGMIAKALQVYREKQADSLVSVLEVPHQFNPHWVFEEQEGHLRIATGEDDIIKRRQDLPPAYYRDGALYISDAALIREGKSLLGQRLSYVLSDPDRYVNIDHESDWQLAEQRYQQLFQES
jgi:CMP-N,N'-diacetyllegionaminic acid synthase